jgi:hypothetical protein
MDWKSYRSLYNNLATSRDRAYVNVITYESGLVSVITGKAKKAQSLVINMASNAYPTMAGGATRQ